MSKYTDYYNERVEKRKERITAYKEEGAALREDLNELRELHSMLKAGLSEQQKADLDLIIDGGAAVHSGEAGWRDDVPDESKPDQENVSVPQEGEHIIEKRNVSEEVEGNEVPESNQGDRGGESRGATEAEEVNHPLASWIMEQEWVENITADITEPEKISYVMGEYVLEGGTVVNIEELFSDFTPKGWERYSEATTRNGLNYDFVEPTGEVWINQTHQDLMDVAIAVHVLFIREHQPESKDDEQNTELEAGKETEEELQSEEQSVDTGRGDNDKSIDVDRVVENADGGVDFLDPRTSGIVANPETQRSCEGSLPEDNGLEYLIKEQAKEFTPEEQKFIDLVEKTNGHTPDNSPDNGASNDAEDDMESSSDIVDREVSDEK